MQWAEQRVAAADALKKENEAFLTEKFGAGELREKQTARTRLNKDNPTGAKSAATSLQRAHDFDVSAPINHFLVACFIGAHQDSLAHRRSISSW